MLLLLEKSSGSALQGRPRVLVTSRTYSKGGSSKAVNALVRDPLRWDLYLARDVVQGKKGAVGGGEELTGVGSTDEYLV